jgi:hypothetical protein
MKKNWAGGPVLASDKSDGSRKPFDRRHIVTADFRTSGKPEIRKEGNCTWPHGRWMIFAGST